MRTPPQLRPGVSARPGWRRRTWLLVLAGILVVSVGVVAYGCHQQAARLSDRRQAAPPFNHRQVAPTQVVLPFTGLSGPEGVAVDSIGNVYVADTGNSRVVKLAPESGAQQVVAFTGLNKPFGVAVDPA
ncbi:MAG: hypothetical protein J2P17_01935, partial [Mycobacterium sp.]|nr:hypothetical protein [Mycobacterium sp.]